MTRRRWIADQISGDTAALVGEHAQHLSRVLRAQVGQEFDVAAGGSVRVGKITSISEDRVEFALGAVSDVRVAARVTLVLAIFKFDRMEWAIEKCTEIGVARIVPVVAQRTDAHLAAAAVKRQERWERLVRQAAEQSRRVGVPEVASPVKLKDLDRALLVDSNVSAVRVVLAETESEVRLRDVLLSSHHEATLAIGPEGGWTEEELQWFRQAGWATASLGDTILRAETAAIVATALALDVLR
jgi:16S rRNA (uracil1498-N3)-methyltransferase